MRILGVTRSNPGFLGKLIRIEAGWIKVKILTTAEMQSADRSTSERFGIPSLDLMEAAGSAVARFVLRELAHCRRVTVLCGRGNNGGDGMVAARVLAGSGRQCSVVILGDPAAIHGDARAMLEKLPAAPIAIRTEAELYGYANIFDETELFLDAVLGTGFHPPLHGLAVAGRELLLRYPRIPVVSVDLPSGWDADARTSSSIGAYRSDAVVTFTAPKLAHVFGNLTGSGELVQAGNVKKGPVVVAGIGSPEDAVVSATGLVWTGAAKSMTDQPRPSDSNKGKFGHVVVIGGSRGKAGAPAMASLAALRSGAGLVTAAIPDSILPTVAGAALELMTIGLAEGSHGEISSANLGSRSVEAILARKTVVAIGPGMGTDRQAVDFFFGLLDRIEVPLVIDADGLNALATGIDRLDGRGRFIVLTPHPGEMARLTGRTVSEVQSHREELAREFAAKHSVTLVLKGWRTLVAHPGGELAVNTTGNPGMAKGGSGDILTGIIAGLVSQYPDRAGEAVDAAVYLHGLAADFAVTAEDQHSLIATDTVAHLKDAFRFQHLDAAGYTWLEGLPGSLRACGQGGFTVDRATVREADRR